MKILMIGGTGTISSAITRQLAAAGHDLWLLNRGTRKNEVPAGVTQIIADIDDEQKVLDLLGENTFDAVCGTVYVGDLFRIQSRTDYAVSAGIDDGSRTAGLAEYACTDQFFTH